jgi:uncharacterized protein YkwD
MTRTINSLAVIATAICLFETGAFAQRKSPTPAPTPKPVATKPALDPMQQLLSAYERDVFAEINLARTKPAQYLRYLEDFKSNYHGKDIRFPDGSILVTNEGVDALEEAIKFVRLQQPLPPLQLRKGMILGARDHANDIAKNDQTGHRGSDGSTPEDRISRYGTWGVAVGEDIVYQSRTPRVDVISLIIDDGVRTRGHRKNIFKPDFHVMGLAMTPRKEKPPMCVITFAGDFTDRGKSGAPAAQRY